MTDDIYARTRLLLGSKKLEKLNTSRVAVFGLGGVGGYAAEALVRSGIGSMDVFDGDKICESNLNRQILATHSSIGKAKTEAFKARALDINPCANIRAFEVFYSKDNSNDFDLGIYDYIIDAIDTVPSKVELVKNACEKNIPVISCMGAGNKLDPSAFRVDDIYKTSVCPLARIMRKKLKELGIKKLKVVYSTELPSIDCGLNDDKNTGKRPIGSLATVVAAAGMLLANEVIFDLCRD